MMHRTRLCLLLWCLASPPAQDAVRLRPIGIDQARGVASAVVLERGALVHTATMFGDEPAGGATGRPAAHQAARALDHVADALAAAGTSLDHLVRLHVYVADAAVTPAVDALLTERFGGRTHAPALTLVESALPPGAFVAMDAVAAAPPSGEPGTPVRLAVDGLRMRTPRASHVSIQPAGPFVVVSGRAARGEFEPAIRETLEQLRADLAGVGLTFEHVVQIKSFLGDMSRAAALETIVASAFEGPHVPPQVVTEWRQEGVPAEIELIATAPAVEAGADAEYVAHVEPIAGRYSRVAQVSGGRPVFVSGLHGTSSDPVAQVDEMFASLARILDQAGSGLRHLVKATYYVADARADERINTIRPGFFDPARPPAASKLTVRGTGRPGRASTFDMIAIVPER